MKYWILIKGLRYNSLSVNIWDEHDKHGDKTGKSYTSDYILQLMAEHGGSFINDPCFEQRWPKLYIAHDKSSNQPYHLIIRKSDKDEDCVVMPFCDGKAGETKFSLFCQYRLHEITGPYKTSLLNAFKNG